MQLFELPTKRADRYLFVDAKGRVVPTAAHNVTLSWAAGLTYLGGGNGDPASLVPDKSAARPARREAT